MRKTRGNTATYLVQYILLRMFLAFTRALPFQARVRFSGAVIAWLIVNMANPKKRIEQNLQRVFPKMPAAERLDIRRRIGKNFGRTYIEILIADAYAKHPELWHASGPGLEVVKSCAKEGKGVILVSGHFGQWDAPRHYLKSQGIEVGAVYRPSNNHFFDRIFVPQIQVAGTPVFGAGRGTIDMVRHVRSNGMIAILLDQKTRKGEVLEFMGHPATTSTAAASLALKYDIPMVPVYGVRRADSLDVDVVFEAPIPPTDATTMTQAANDSLAARVRANPGQWYWLHKRWKIRGK